LGDTYEVEVKIAIDSYEEMEKRILNVGAEKSDREVQIDSYFDHPCRKFQDTDEALRVRSSSPSGLIELTYKGPRIDNNTKTRIEASVILDDANEIVSILENLSFRLVATVTKTRQFFSLPSMTISIDKVEDVGLFMELESIAKTKDVAQARDNIFEMMRKLGLDPKESIRESYLELYWER
jgi:adenylate cyclase class 2